MLTRVDVMPSACVELTQALMQLTCMEVILFREGNLDIFITIITIIIIIIIFTIIILLGLVVPQIS